MKKYYSLTELKKLTDTDIIKLKINKIIGKSNFSDDFVSDILVCDKIMHPYLRKFLEFMIENYTSNDSHYYYWAASEEYELYRFEP